MHNSHLNRLSLFQARLLQLPFYSINSSQIKRLQTTQNALAHAVTKTPKHHHITPKITSPTKNPSTHPLQNSMSYTYNTLQTFQPSYIRQLLTIQPPGIYSLVIISFLVSPSNLILFEVLQLLLCVYMLRCTSSLERTPKRLPRQLHILLTHLLISPILRSHSPLLHSTRD